MTTNRELKISRHVNRWPSRMGGLFVISLLLTGSILGGYSAHPVNSYHTLSVSELEAQIAHKTEELKTLESEREENIRQKGIADPSVEARIRRVEDEISVLARWRVRLIHLQTSGRYSGPR